MKKLRASSADIPLFLSKSTHTHKLKAKSLDGLMEMEYNLRRKEGFVNLFIAIQWLKKGKELMCRD